jgi:hypothetical protein
MVNHAQPPCLKLKYMPVRRAMRIIQGKLAIALGVSTIRIALSKVAAYTLLDVSKQEGARQCILLLDFFLQKATQVVATLSTSLSQIRLTQYLLLGLVT